MFLIKEVTLSYGAKVLFNEISETIGPRDRIALVGSNGSGKTTLLRLLMGEESPDEGSIEKPDYATVGYLPRMEFPHPVVPFVKKRERHFLMPMF